MTNEEVNKYWSEVCLPIIKMFAKYRIEYSDDVDFLVRRAYKQGCAFAYNKSFEEVNSKNVYEIIHQILVDKIIDEVDKCGGSVDLKEGYYVDDATVSLTPDGLLPTGGFIKRLETNGHSLIFDIPNIEFKMQNEMSFSDLLHIYKLIP